MTLNFQGGKMNRRTFLGAAVGTIPAMAALKRAGSAAGNGRLNRTKFKEEEEGRSMKNQEVKELTAIDLPVPEKAGGKTVLEALWLRRTNRDIKPDALSPQTLSNLLWAGFGLNRPEGSMMRGKAGRTAASAGLAAWFHNCDREKTPKEFKLNPEQKVLFAMTVGQPAAAATSSRR